MLLGIYFIFFIIERIIGGEAPINYLSIDLVEAQSVFTVRFKLGESNISLPLNLQKEGIMVNCDIYKRELSPTSKLISSRAYLSFIGMVF